MRRTLDMPFHLPPRPSALAAGALLAGALLAAAGCSGQVTPLGPDQTASVPQPQPHHLRSPLILQDMRVQPPGLAGSCPAGYTAMAGSGQCYGHRIGSPVTITSAGVSPVSTFQPPAAAGQQAPPVEYGFWITVPTADETAAATVIPTSSPSPGPPVATAVPLSAGIPTLSVAGHAFALIGFSSQTTDREFEVFLSSKEQATQLQHTLAAAG
jgi:hypothetical protein